MCEVLVKTYQGQIRAFLRRLTRNAALADDLAQDTFLRAFRNLDNLQDKEKTKAWIFQIAYRVFLDDYRKNKRRQDLALENLQTPDEIPSAPHGLKVDVEHAMNSLNPEQRASIILCISYGLSHRQAAKALELPIGTVKSHIARGKDKLRAFLCAYKEA